MMRGFRLSFKFSDEKRRCMAGNGLLVATSGASHKEVCSLAKECVKAYSVLDGVRREIGRLYDGYKMMGYEPPEVRMSLYFAPCRGTVDLHESLGILFVNVTVECRGSASPLHAAREASSLLKRLAERPLHTMRDVSEELPLAPLSTEGVVVEEVLYRGARGDLRVLHGTGLNWRVERR